MRGAPTGEKNLIAHQCCLEMISRTRRIGQYFPFTGFGIVFIEPFNMTIPMTVNNSTNHIYLVATDENTCRTAKSFSGYRCPIPPLICFWIEDEEMRDWFLMWV